MPETGEARYRHPSFLAKIWDYRSQLSRNTLLVMRSGQRISRV
jgi:hypothetical protein